MRLGNLVGIALASLVCSRACIAQESDFLAPVEFEMYVSEESPIRPFAPPHPCGAVLTLRANRVPVGLSDFRVLWAYGLTQSGQVLAKWPLPVDAIPVGAKGDSLIIRQTSNRGVLLVTQDSEIGVPAEDLPSFGNSEPFSRTVACPLSSSLSDASAGYICVTLDDQETGAGRIIAFPPVCT
jgi:hypothetical protein